MSERCVDVAVASRRRARRGFARDLKPWHVASAVIAQLAEHPRQRYFCRVCRHDRGRERRPVGHRASLAAAHALAKDERLGGFASTRLSDQLVFQLDRPDVRRLRRHQLVGQRGGDATADRHLGHVLCRRLDLARLGAVERAALSAARRVRRGGADGRRWVSDGARGLPGVGTNNGTRPQQRHERLASSARKRSETVRSVCAHVRSAVSCSSESAPAPPAAVRPLSCDTSATLVRNSASANLSSYRWCTSLAILTSCFSASRMSFTLPIAASTRCLNRSIAICSVIASS